MNYPLISEYIVAIKSAEDNFKELTNLQPVLGDDGQPLMTSGNFAVVFKMQDIETSKFYALKCFIREQEGREEAYHQIAEELKDVDSPYLVSISYLEKELFVDSTQTEETEFPVLLMDWVEGKTLDKYLRENLDDKFALEMLAYRFSQLAQWLIPLPYAHGDLKPDNILVREDGTLVLVDYDGMYVPAMRGQIARELGSPDFRHPQQTEEDFDEHIDDFPFVSILLSLKAISINPQLLEEYGASDRLLLSEENYRNISECNLLNSLFPSNDRDVNLLVGLLSILLINRDATVCKSTLAKMIVPVINTEEPRQYSGNWIVNDCIRYTPDYKYVLGVCGIYNELPYVPYDIGHIHKGSLIICDNAFNINSEDNRWRISYDIYDCPFVVVNMEEIPSGVLAIGNYSFCNCRDIKDIHLPNSLVRIGDGAFQDCGLGDITIPDGVVNVGRRVFYDCKNLISVILPSNIVELPQEFFAGCVKLVQVAVPQKLKIIGRESFKGCTNLETITIPQRVKRIEDYAFGGCISLNDIDIPESVTEIGEGAFSGCKSFRTFRIPNGIRKISDHLLSGCSNLSEIDIPESVTEIGLGAFLGCKSLQSIKIPISVKSVESWAFKDCINLHEIHLTNCIEKIGFDIFDNCPNLEKIVVPYGAKTHFTRLLKGYENIMKEVTI